MKTFHLQVLVRRRANILDPQGQALEKSLSRLGFKGVEDVRVDKEIRLSVQAQNLTEAKLQAKKMCERLLVNPVLEDAVITPVEKPA